MEKNVVYLAINTRPLKPEIVFASLKKEEVSAYIHRKETEAYELGNSQLDYGNPAEELLEEKELRELQFLGTSFGLYDFKQLKTKASLKETTYVDEEGVTVVFTQEQVLRKLRECTEAKKRKKKLSLI